MNNLVSELTAVISKEAQLYADMLTISDKKTEIIVAGRVSELEEMVKTEEMLVLNISKYEFAREDIVEKIAAQLKVSSDTLTVSELVAKLDAEQAKELDAIRKSILDIIDKLKDKNEVNSKLIKNSLEFINFSINILSNVENESNNYGSTGQVREPGKRNFFDVKL